MSDLVHGVDMLSVTEGARSIRTARSAVIGMIGTAPDAATEGDYAFPLNTPVLVTSGTRGKALCTNNTEDGDGGTLLQGLEAIYAQARCAVVMIRVAQGEDADATAANVAGSAVGKTGAYAFLNAEAATGLKPRLLCAPGIRQFYDSEGDIAASAVSTALLAVASRIRAIVSLESPDTDMTGAQDAVDLIGANRKRAFMVDPALKVGDLVVPNSAYICALFARTDNERGWQHTPSNKFGIAGITGTHRLIDFAYGDPACEADILNGSHVNTIIRKNGWRLWGSRTAETEDSRWRYINVVRIDDIIQDTIAAAIQWAVDEAIDYNFSDAVTGTVNAVLRQRVAEGRILGGECFPNPDLNTAAAVADGQTFFDYAWTPVFPAEKVTVRSRYTLDYAEGLFS